MASPSALRLSKLVAIARTRSIYRNPSTVKFARYFQTNSTPSASPRHFLSIADLSTTELSTLVRQASKAKNVVKFGNISAPLQGFLTGKTVAMLFSKRSTRTRVSTEAAVVYLGGHPMFLGKDDIQLGVSHTLALNPSFLFQSDQTLIMTVLRSTSRSTIPRKSSHPWPPVLLPVLVHTLKLSISLEILQFL